MVISPAFDMDFQASSAINAQEKISQPKANGPDFSPPAYSA
jgi:hypothetical protein